MFNRLYAPVHQHGNQNVVTVLAAVEMGCKHSNLQPVPNPPITGKLNRIQSRRTRWEKQKNSVIEFVCLLG